jgi:AcrR family transcriptional regulator
MPRSAAETRRRILAAAYRLFYREGFQRSGVDAVAAASGVTKRTLYNHFPSKDALIAAVLDSQAEMAAVEIARWAEAAPQNPVAIVRGIFAGLRTWAQTPGWRGPGFTRAAMELAWAPGHPARAAAAAQKRLVEMRLTEALAKAGAANPAVTAATLAVLMEGAMALRLIHGSDAPIDTAEAAALALIGLSDPDCSA